MAADRPTTLYDLDRGAFGELLGDQPRYRVDQLWSGLYQDLAPVQKITTLPKALRTRLSQDLPPALAEVQVQTAERGQTIKWLWSLHDGHQVETVLMLYRDRATVCVSSQAGCAMACGFCATGQAGFDRHLSVGEIVEQVVLAARTARDNDRRVSNIVFMGMGEPLANYTNTWSAVERFHADLGISARSLTVSTVGVVPGIDRLAQAGLPVTLAVSLHAANDELRDELVPINRRYPLDDLAQAMRRFRQAKGRRVSIEWAMIADVNDRESDAVELASFARRTRAHINLIPLNPTPGYPVVGSARTRLYSFRDRLEEIGANATVRRTRGVDIDAACGQLAARHRGDSTVAVASPRSLRS